MSATEIRAAEADQAAQVALAQGDVWITRAQVAQRLQVPHQTLATWAYQKRGPKFTKFGRHTRYRLADVITWENEQVTGGAA